MTLRTGGIRSAVEVATVPLELRDVALSNDESADGSRRPTLAARPRRNDNGQGDDVRVTTTKRGC